MAVSALVALSYAVFLAWDALEERRRTGNGVTLVTGFGLAGLAALGAALLASGDPGGRGLALAATVLGALLGTWQISRAVLDDAPRRRPLLRLVLSAACAVVLRSGPSVPADAAPLPGPPEARAADAHDGPIRGIEEASGVARRGDRLYVVGDHEPGTWYECAVPSEGPGALPLRPSALQRHRIAGGDYAIDLEALGFLADGRLVILSERLGCLLDDRGIVCSYDRSLGELGGRGLEGLAVRALPDGRSRVAVLWEGGYPDPAVLPAPVRDAVGDRALTPVVLVHDLAPGASRVDVTVRDARRVVALRVPEPPGAEPWAQRFRAPALVWYRDARDDGGAWGFLVLLSSGWGREPAEGDEACCPKRAHGRPLRWCWKWLQRFGPDGEPWGEPFDLDASFPEELRTVNWEGMGWFEEGKSLVFVYDERVDRRAVDPQVAWVVPLPEGW